ncbi:hypothetical protein HHL28_10605 [Aerophototrophica crusticola]|uniref:Uncharacterized protein n=1 Tax=Aerophototrophica crusticola TaxID=1709002 RepID=A0A858R8H0_9PROT|nr:hypothetical protein HHL28_10605 [Rhodospirillaceae bacterium B3]
MSRDFWVSSGHHLLDRADNGGLLVTPDFLRAFLARPEMAPIPESGPRERALHQALLADPTLAVTPVGIIGIEDRDARENYEVWLGFRDRLLAQPTLEAAYLSLMRNGAQRVPHLFVDQLVHLILRNMLDGETDPLRLRAAELLFRPQRVTIQEGGILLADEETVEQRATTGGFGSLGNLLAEAGTAPRVVDLDVMSADNAELYWDRSDRFDMVLDIAFTRPGLDALARVLERWVAHFTRVKVSIQPVQTISDQRWVWHVGLDAEATRILNALWNGEEPGEEALAQVLSLFRLEFADPGDMLERVAGRPVYLALAMGKDKKLRLKPQNLLLNLPFREGGVN